LSFPSPISRFPSPKIQFSSPKIQFSLHEIQFTQIGFLLSLMAFRFLQQLSDFLQWLSAFSNGFPNFSNGFPIFLNGFPLSKKSEKIYLWREVYKRSLFKLPIFHHSSFVITAKQYLHLTQQFKRFQFCLITNSFQQCVPIMFCICLKFLFHILYK
jgi:hypothetical protein